MSGADPYRTLQVDPAACPEVIEAAYTVLREQACRDDSDAAPRRLADLMRAHRVLSDPGARARLDEQREQTELRAPERPAPAPTTR